MTTTSDTTGDTPPRTSNDKLTELLDAGLPALRESVRSLTGSERAIGTAMLAATPFIEPRLRAELIARPAAELDAVLHRAAMFLLALRSDNAERVSVPADAGELELLRRQRDWCQSEHHGALEGEG